MKKIKIGDIAVIAFVLLVSAVFLCLNLFADDGGKSVIVSVGGQEKVFSIDENREIEIENNGIELLVLIENGGVFVERSDCAGNDCVNMGEISRKGSMIACAPAEVLIKISGEGESGYDYLIG